MSNSSPINLTANLIPTTIQQAIPYNQDSMSSSPKNSKEVETILEIRLISACLVKGKDIDPNAQFSLVCMDLDGNEIFNSPGKYLAQANSKCKAIIRDGESTLTNPMSTMCCSCCGICLIVCCLIPKSKCTGRLYIKGAVKFMDDGVIYILSASGRNIIILYL
jgi:hypothetical protein